MAEYLDKSIGNLELGNQAGVKCYLECYYKSGKDGSAKRIGKSGSILLGQSGTLNLRELGLSENDEIWVTAYANVSAGDDSSGDVWLRYDHKSTDTATFVITGTAFKTATTFDRISTGDEYFDTHITQITLNNQSGTVCSLECYYKKGKDGTPKRVGDTSTIPVGQSVSLNLLGIDELKDQVNSDETIWVTAYANVSLGEDCYGSSWFPFKSSSAMSEAVYSIIGVINFTYITFNKIIAFGNMTGYAIPVDVIYILDHSYVHVSHDNELVKFGCFGREDGGAVVCSNDGDTAEAIRIAGEDGHAGIVYARTGVCHQTSNRILYPAGITVDGIAGYGISTALFGVYGIGDFLHNVQQPCADEYFRKLQELQQMFRDTKNNTDSFIDRTAEELMLLAERKLGARHNIPKEGVREIVAYGNAEHSKLVEQENLTEESLKAQLNELANQIAGRFATIMSDEDYYTFIGARKGERIAIA